MDKPIMPSLPGLAIRTNLLGHERPIVEALLCATDHGILMTDAGGQDVLCNPQFGRLFGIDPEQVVRMSRDEVRRAALARVRDPAEFVRQLERAYARPEIEYEDDVELCTEPPRVLHRYTGPVRDASGSILGRVWTFKDVTELRRLEAEVRDYSRQVEEHARRQAEELRVTAEVLSAITSVSGAIYGNRDEQSLVESMARTCRGLLGQDSTLLLMLRDDGRLVGAAAARTGEDVKRAALRVDADAALAELLQSRSAGVGPSFSVCHPARGSALARITRSSALCVATLRWAGEAVGLLALGSNDPESLLAPNRRPHLEGVATQITLALRIHMGRTQLQEAFDALKKTQERMAEAEKLTAVGTMAASVAHDIRNILTPLRLELAAAPDPRNPGNLSPALAQVNRLSALTHRLLAIALPGDFKAQACDVRETVENAIALIHAQAEVDGIEVRTRFARALPPCAGDSRRLEHVFINLFLNAIKAMRVRGGVLSVAASVENGGVRVNVRDTGEGIPPEVRTRIFDPFFTTHANGSGLGLYSVKRIMEEHNGWIRLTSRPRESTCFSVWLPAIDGQA